jgi:C-terminal peptidase prc
MKRITISAILAILFSFNIAVAPVQAKPQQHPTAPTTQTVQPVKPAAQQFDGHLLYQKAFEAFRDNHILLADPAARAKWAAEWEHKFDKGDQLKTPEGTDKAIVAMKESLQQRFDYFFDESRTKAEQDEVSAQLVGIGATLELRDVKSIIKSLPKDATIADFEKALVIGPGHELLVKEPIEGGPAAQYLKPGDVITKVDGKPVAGLTQKDAIARIKGDAGTTVSITVQRADDKGGNSELTFTITRAKVRVPVVHTRDMGDGVTYIKLDNFMSGNATREMYTALKKASNGKGIILDLRGNPGGELNAVFTMAAFMIPEGTILVTEARSGDNIGEHHVIANRNFILTIDPDDKDPQKVSVDLGDRPPLVVPENMPIVVLVDEGSASASEILSGALQANHRAIVVGKPTVGKGVGQTVIDLPFGRRLHVTSFQFLPGGKKMDWIGIIPNVEVDQANDDGATDKQLDEAVKQIKQQIATEASRQQEADALEKANHKKFEDALQKKQQGGKDDK